MIRISKHTLKFANKGKLKWLDRLFDDYKVELQGMVDLMWEGRLPIKKLASSKNLEGKVFENAQWIAKTYKRASAILRSGAKSQEKGHPIIRNASIDLYSMDFREQKSKDFDGFFRVRLPYKLEKKKGKKKYYKIFLPIKFHRHSRRYSENGWKLLKTFRLIKSKGIYYVHLFWEKPEEVKRAQGPSIGIDTGYKKLISDSNGNHYGEHLENFYLKLSRKKHGSRKYKRLILNKKNEVNKVCNDFERLSLPRELFVEDLKNVKHKSKINTKFMNRLQYWSYKQVLKKMERLSEEKGFIFGKVDPSYTSQTCSSCGTVEKSNRNGEIYECICGLKIDADHNAAINILHRGVYRPSTEQNGNKSVSCRTSESLSI
jgi:IS605 OrfB family transposase